MQFQNILLAALLGLPLSYAQQVADGLIVPFTSKLPACASKCGPLFDVQGKCTPPNIASVDISCFCSDNRLRAISDQGTAGVSSVCGPASCTTSTDLASIQNWYKGFCINKVTASTTAKGSASTSTGSPSSSSSNVDNSWFATHKRWVIMIIIVTVGIIVIWVGAWLLRRRYLRKKEKEIEMRPPVAWGPHQSQAASGGYKYGDGVVDARGARPPGAPGGHHKEAAGVIATPANGSRLKKEKMGWFKSTKA